MCDKEQLSDDEDHVLGKHDMLLEDLIKYIIFAKLLIFDGAKYNENNFWRQVHITNKYVP